MKTLRVSTQIMPVYAVIVLIIYTWTMLWFFWKLPSWLYFLTAGEILTSFAYAMATNFAESLAVLCAPVMLGILLPKKWFYDVFVARGASLVMAGLGYMIYVAYQFQTKDSYPSLSLKPWSFALALALILLFVFVVGQIAFLRRVFEFVADRAVIFLYISIPLSILSIVVILIHWII